MLPWQAAILKAFPDEAAVAQFVDTQIEESGVYQLPGATTAEGAVRPMDEWGEAWRKGPYVSAFISKGPQIMDMNQSLLGSFLIQLAAALVLGFILLLARAPGCGARLSIVFLASVFAAIMSWLPPWNWYNWPLDYIGVYIAHLLVAGIISGTILAALVRPVQAGAGASSPAA